MVPELDRQPDLNLRYLHMVMTRIDLLFRREICRWRRAGQDPADTFRGLYVSHEEVDSLFARPIGGNWGRTGSLTEAEAAAFTQAEAQLAQQSQELLKAATQAQQTIRLVKLSQLFGLNQFEQDVFLLCLASSLDLRYEKVYGYLQDDVTRKKPTINLAFDLLGQAGLSRLQCLKHFTDQAPLFQHRLLKRDDSASGSTQLSQTLGVDETIVHWLFGEYTPGPDLKDRVTLIDPQTINIADAQTIVGESHPDLAVLAEGHAQGDKALNNPAPIYIFYGPDRLGQAMAAQVMAYHLARPLLILDLAQETEFSAAINRLNLAFRDAQLIEALPYVTGWDQIVQDETKQDITPLFQTLYACSQALIVGGEQRWQPHSLDHQRPLRWVNLPNPSYTHRLHLWPHFLTDASQFPAAANTETDASTADLAALAGQFALTRQQIRDAGLYAQEIAQQAGRPLAMDDFLSAARAYSNPRLTTLARKIEPRYQWDDIILPEDQRVILQEIIGTVRGRAKVLEEWGVGQKLASSAGITVLFAGPPGTGKTMAAEVICNELGLDLYKIDLSSIISKYIGETEKNLEKIFNEAQSSNAILFFDEADAIFGKRSEVKDAHDRYANIEVSYLLQRMEAYDGVTILATNLRANLDEAFTRRLQFAIDFPFPEEDDRLRIWETLFPPNVPRADDLDFELFAQRFRLAGGNIRNIIVSAAYLAAADGGKVTMGHLLHGTRRELQKMGRWVDEGDLEP